MGMTQAERAVIAEALAKVSGHIDDPISGRKIVFSYSFMVFESPNDNEPEVGQFGNMPSEDVPSFIETVLEIFRTRTPSGQEMYNEGELMSSTQQRVQ